MQNRPQENRNKDSEIAKSPPLFLYSIRSARFFGERPAGFAVISLCGRSSPTGR